MIKPYFFTAIVFLLTGCAPALKPGEFKLAGIVTGYKDSTVIYFQIDDKQDSTLIIDNKFGVSGVLKRAPYQAILHVKNTQDYKVFWLEKSEMTFKAAKGDFRQAAITGSETQLEDDKLQKMLRPLHNQAEKAKDEAAFYKIQTKIFDGYGKFIESNPNSLVGVEFLSKMAPAVGKAKAKRMYDHLSEAMKNTPQGKVTLKFLTLNKEIAIGKPFADFTQYDVDGKPVKLSDFKGNVILLDFWASWCHPCREENPNLVNTYNVYKADGFKIVAVSVDDSKADWVAAIKKDGLPYVNVSEKNGGENTAHIIYGINKYPSNYLIDKNGLIIAQDLRGEALGKALQKIYQ